MNVPDRIVERLGAVLFGVFFQMRPVFVDGLRDDVEIEFLRRFRILEHVERQALRRGVGEPLLDGDAVALGLGDLLAVLVEKQLVVEARRRLAAQRLDHPVRQANGFGEVFPGHFIVDAERIPAPGPVDLPLQLGAAAAHRGAGFFAVLVLKDDFALFRVDLEHRHIEHPARGRRDREDRRIAGAPLLAEGRQDDLHHRVIPFKHADQRVVELAGAIAGGRRDELIIEAELVEKGAQLCVVVMGETFMAAPRIGDVGQRLLQIAGQHFLVRHLRRDFAHAVHVVGKGDQTGLAPGEQFERAAHHGGARHLAEGADMGRAGRAVTGLEHHRAVLFHPVEPLDQRFRLLKRPGFGVCGVGGGERLDLQGGHGVAFRMVRKARFSAAGPHVNDRVPATVAVLPPRG